MQQKCIIWGAGYYGKRLMGVLSQKTEYKIVAYCDRNISLVGKKVDTYEIVSIEQAIDMCCTDEELAILIGIFDYNLIREVEQTIKNNFPPNTKIIIGHDIQDEVENDLIRSYHKTMKFQWKVDLERYFLDWLSNIMSEVEYWVKEVASGHGTRHGYNIMCRKNDRFTHEKILERVQANDIVLDIGCGLVSKFGNELEDGSTIQMVPVDALAHFYNEINRRIQDGLKKDYQCQFGMFEFLGNLFEQGYADYIIIDNALDHCIEPWRSLVECLYVLKTGGRMYLNHRRAEAVYENWTGLHKWNIDCKDGDLIIWNKENAVNVTEALKEIAEVHVSYDETVCEREQQGIGVEIVKKKEFELASFVDIYRENLILTKCIDKLMEKLAVESKSFVLMLEQEQL